MSVTVGKAFAVTVVATELLLQPLALVTVTLCADRDEGIETPRKKPIAAITISTRAGVIPRFAPYEKTSRHEYIVRPTATLPAHQSDQFRGRSGGVAWGPAIRGEPSSSIAAGSEGDAIPLVVRLNVPRGGNVIGPPCHTTMQGEVGRRSQLRTARHTPGGRGLQLAYSSAFGPSAELPFARSP